MKTFRRIALGAAVLAALLAAGCASSGNTQQGGNNRQGGQMPAMAGTQGVITAVSESSITIAVMPADSMPQGGQRPSGSGAPEKPSGTPPSDGSGKQPSATRDTSSWEKKAYAIDSSTKIVEMQFGNSSNAKSTALKVSDLTVGGSVSIEESKSKAGTAGTITVMRGMGGPGGPRGEAVPAATSKSK